MNILQLWKNGNAAVAIVTYGEGSTIHHAERGVFDGMKWQWRTMGKYQTAAKAEKRINKEMADYLKGWHAATWQREI